MDINNLDFVLDTDEKVNKFFNALKLHNKFEQVYIFKKIVSTKINKDTILRSPMYYLFTKSMYEYLEPIGETMNHLNIMNVAGFSMQDQRDYVESNKLFIVQLDPDVANISKDPIATFKTKTEAEEFIKEWEQLNTLEKIVKFLKRPRIQYGYAVYDHYEVICREFILINKGLTKDPIQTISQMVLENIPNDEIQAYYMMHQICK